MLAQNFKSAVELKISDAEHLAAVKVLGMLEREELLHQPKTHSDWGVVSPASPYAFNMECSGQTSDCGTIACIGGWMAVLMGEKGIGINHYVNSDSSEGLHDLFWGNTRRETTTDQAATALRSFLTTGDARWDLAVA